MKINNYNMFNTGASYGLNNNNSGNDYSYLSDYKQIKSGAYKKLMKAYYSQDENLKSNAEKIKAEKTASKDDTAKIKDLKDNSSKLAKSASDLYDNKKKDLYTSEKTDDMVKGVKSFVDDYNNLIKSAGDSKNNKVTRTATNLINSTSRSQKLLNDVGITANEDGTLKVDEEKLKTANKSTVKTLFSGNGSFASNVGTAANFINSYASQDAAKASGTYNAAGMYGSYLGTGNLFDIMT